MYEYSARLIRVIDGDTVHLDVDLGFDVKRRDSFRLYGIDTPELPTPEGKAAAARLVELLAAGPIILRTVKDKREKFGRYLGLLEVDRVDVNARLVEEGHAVLYGEARGR
ncbi:MAG: thermonuclease family protein [Chloroflexi bacterium]|nr:thermonuclease family protein [Chloroflexota bacterium]